MMMRPTVWAIDPEKLAEGINAGYQFIAEVGRALEAALDQVRPFFRPGYPYRPGDPVPAHCRIVRPAKGGTTWFGWDHDAWRPVHRVAGVGWVWGTA